MKIAVTYEAGQVFQHFGHCAAFKIYEIKDQSIVSSQVVGTQGQGHSALAGFLQERQVDVLICGGIGGCARVALDAAGIQIYGGVSGDVEDAVVDFLAGNLHFDPNASCSHHEGNHTCGDHCH